MNQAYVYKWTHKPTLMWYVGSRTNKNAHPFDGYICSSKTVKPMIESNPTEWTREIVAIGSPKEMLDLEKDILMTVDAMNDPRSFNRSNGGRNFRGREHALKAWATKRKNGTAPKAWNKGLAKEQQPNYGKRHPGKPWTRSEKGEKMLETLREKNKIRNAEQATCPHCGKSGQKIAMSRFHFDRCALTQKGGV